MRTGGCTLQQTLTAESASVLKHSLNLARRRGHAQVTPLHVAATLLSSRTSILRRACIKSHPGFSSNYQFAHSLHRHDSLQCRALELCFNVALNRLPTVPGPMFHGQPSLANALIAALKRAQAHKRRGCIEQQQQMQQQSALLTIKIELEQLVRSILDDPSVNRVMREAGFSSVAVKNCIEDCSISSVLYGSSTGVFSSPCSPSSNDHSINLSHHQKPKDLYQPVINPSNFWRTHLLNHSPEHNQLLITPNKKVLVAESSSYLKEDVKSVFDVLLRKKKKNPVIVGDSVSSTEGLVSELMSKIERGDVDHGYLKQTHFVKFHFSSIALKFMKREDVETNVSELRKKVISLTSCGKGVIIYTGDMNWTVGENNSVQISSSSSSYSPLDHLVEEVGRLIDDYNKIDDNYGDNNSSTSLSSKKRVWLMGTATYQTYMRCQMRQPSLETLWSLQAVSIPSGGLGLSLHATSGNESKTSKISSHVGEAKSFGGRMEELSDLTCCSECVSNYEREATSFKSNQKDLLPSWLQPHRDSSSHKDELNGLRRKWNRFCQSLHQGKSYSYAMPYPWWSNQNGGSPKSTSTSYVDSGLKVNQRGNSNSVAKFRCQNLSTFKFDLDNDSQTKDEQKGTPKMETLGETRGKDKEITLNIDSGREVKQIGILVEALKENIPWQSENLSSVAEILMDCVWRKRDGWVMIGGDDTMGKRRLAVGVSETLFGSIDALVHIDLRKRGKEDSIIVSNALEMHKKVVFLIEDIDSADPHFLKVLSDRFDENERSVNGFDRQAIFILTKEDSNLNYGKHVESISQISEQNCPAGKRKFESDLSEKEAKKHKTEEIGKTFGVKREVFSRQSSFNSSLDLNIEAEESEKEEEEEEDISPISSDLTGDETQISPDGFLGRIPNRFMFESRTTKQIKETSCAKFGEIYGGRWG